jgi:hypothetical protein
MRVTPLLAAFGAAAAGFSLALAGRAGSAEPLKPTLRHVVLYQFKETVGPEQVAEVVDAFAALPGKIPTIVAFERGTNVSPEGKSQGLTHAFVVSFRDEKGRDEYLAHPAHQKYVELVRDRREKVIVFDYWAR